MNDCYCKNCNNLVGKWHNKDKWYIVSDYCNFIESKDFNSICFLDCKNCNKFIGLEFWYICKNCFGKKEIFGEENLFNWFKGYKKIILQNLEFTIICKICYCKIYRHQSWFFKELTFYK